MNNNVIMHKALNNGVLLKEWDENCSKKSEDFLLARQKGNFESCFHEFVYKSDILIPKDSFVYFLDEDFHFFTSIQNITPNYGKIISGGFKDLLFEDDNSNTYCLRSNSVIKDIKYFIDRIVSKLLEQDMFKQADSFKNMWDAPAATFEEGLQRVLFLNQLLWQTGSRLIGLGRLDLLLYHLYTKDVKEKKLTTDGARTLIGDFLRILHRDYWFKSNVLLGDTGQVIIVGGLNNDETYFSNDLTYIFVEEVSRNKLSDPKIVLRTSKKMPRDLMETAVKCMATGCGSPLLSNDDVIIPRLIKFGIAREDAFNYTTSACWEPLIGGLSSSMNNQGLLVYPRAMHNLLLEERCDRFKSFEQLKERYLLYLRREVLKSIKCIYEQKYIRNTLYSVFIEGCYESKKDIVDGGAKYHNIGMTVAGLGNTINSLMNIKKFVFDKSIYTLEDVKRICLLNYEEDEKIADMLKMEKSYYGTDDEFAISLTNELQGYVTELTKDFRTSVGGKLKFGASSPSHIMAGSDTLATFDGRKKGESLIVHISNEKAESYTEIINFAAGLDYDDNRFNGNVVDFVVSPRFIDNHFDKFVTLLLRGTEIGYFQLQTNVVHSDVLIEAKKHPEDHQGLIVRVWGFSAYFVELPESYQDLLINRALQAERRSA